MGELNITHVEYVKHPCTNVRVECNASLGLMVGGVEVARFHCSSEAGHTLHTPTHSFRTNKNSTLKAVTIMWSDDEQDRG